MRTTLVSLTILALATGWAAVAAEPVPGPGTNLVEGGSFEGLAPGLTLPKSWYRFQKPNDVSHSVVQAGGRNDDLALYIDGRGEYSGVATNTVKIDPEKQYITRAWVKVDDPAGCEVFEKLDLFDANRKYITSLSGTPIRIKGSGWQLLSRAHWIRSQEGVGFVAVAVGVQGKGAAWFDDIELRESSSPKDNMLADGGMEAVQGSQPTQWHLAQDPAGTVRMLRRTVPVHEGWYCIELKGNAKWAAADGGSLPIEKGYRYTLTGWARTRTGKAQVRLGYFDHGNYLGSTNSNDMVANEWRQFTVVADTDRFPQADKLYASGLGLGGEMDVFFDDFVLKREKL